MKRINWWWGALASVVAISSLVPIVVAQSPADDGQTFGVPADDLAVDLLEPSGDDGFLLDDELGGGGGMDRSFGMHGSRGAGKGRGRGRGMERGHGMGFGMRLEALDLTDEQRTKIQTIHEREMRKSIQARADLELARFDLHKLMRAENPDRRAIEAQIDKVSNLQVTMHKSRLGVMFETRALLTDAQKKQLNEMRHGGTPRGKRGMGHGTGDGSSSSSQRDSR